MSILSPKRIYLSLLGSYLNTDDGDEHHIKVDDVFKYFSDQAVESFPLLPIDCIQYFKRNNCEVVVLEHEPSVKTVSYLVRSSDISNDRRDYPEYYREEETCYNCRRLHGDNRDCSSCPMYRAFFEKAAIGDIITATIPVPRMLHFILVGTAPNGFFKRKSFIFALRNPLTSVNDVLFQFPLGNLYPTGEVCWGDEVYSATPSLIGFSGLTNRYFNSIFNNDLDNNSMWDPSVLDNNQIKSCHTRSYMYFMKGLPEINKRILKQNPETPTYRDMLRRLTDGRY